MFFLFFFSLFFFILSLLSQPASSQNCSDIINNCGTCIYTVTSSSALQNCTYCPTTGACFELDSGSQLQSQSSSSSSSHDDKFDICPGTILVQGSGNNQTGSGSCQQAEAPLNYNVIGSRLLTTIWGRSTVVIQTRLDIVALNVTNSYEVELLDPDKVLGMTLHPGRSKGNDSTVICEDDGWEATRVKDKLSISVYAWDDLALDGPYSICISRQIPANGGRPIRPVFNLTFSISVHSLLAPPTGTPPPANSGYFLVLIVTFVVVVILSVIIVLKVRQMERFMAAAYEKTQTDYPKVPSLAVLHIKEDWSTMNSVEGTVRTPLHFTSEIFGSLPLLLVYSFSCFPSFFLPFFLPPVCGRGEIHPLQSLYGGGAWPR